MSQGKIGKIPENLVSFEVSVVIPTFDRRELLRRALLSVQAQTLQPREIWVVDDGSTDGTGELITREFPGVGYLRQENRGVSAARNLGLSRCRAPWIAFLDSDDTWHEAKLERQVQALAESPEHRLCHTDEIWIRRGRRVNPRQSHAKPGGWIFRQCLPLCAISPSSVLLHRSVFGEVGTFDEALPACEDYDLWLRIASRMPVLLLEEPLVTKYGGHEDQLSRRIPALDRYRIKALEKILREGRLTSGDRQAAVDMLQQKIDIYAAGLRKRGREQEARDQEAILARWTAEVGV